MSAGRQLVDVKAVARVLGLSDEQVQKLARSKRIPKAGHGKYDLLACVRAYVEHLRGVAAGRTSESGDLDIVAERARLASEQADALAMKNAVTREELAPVSDFHLTETTVHALVCQRMLGIPSRCSPAIVNAVRSAIAAEGERDDDTEAPDPIQLVEDLLRERIREALSELSRTPVTAKKAARARAAKPARGGGRARGARGIRAPA